MKVLLISANVASSPYPVYPIGMSMVARALQEAGHNVRQFDFLKSGKDVTCLVDSIKEFMPDSIGISMRNIDNTNYLNEKTYIDFVRKIVSKIRSCTSAPVFLGGTAFSLLPEEILKKVGADYGVVGEGEQLAVELVNILENGDEPGNNILISKPSLHGQQMRRALYDKDIMEYYLANGAIPGVQTKRGCTHKCVYCSYPGLEGHRFRSRDINETVDDIELLVKEHDAKMIFFTDSVFNDDEGYYIKLLEEMYRRRVFVPWSAYMKPDKIDSRTLDLMLKTGVKGLELGSDAATDRTLNGIGKSFKFKDVIECNEILASHGIATANYFMFGGPNENKDTVLQGIENIVNLKNTVSFIFMGIRILPDTAIKKIAVKEGMLGENDNLLDSKYYISPELDSNWMEKTLEEGFKPHKNCIFPPDALDDSVKFLQKMGQKGLLWDMLLPKRRKVNNE